MSPSPRRARLAPFLALALSGPLGAGSPGGSALGISALRGAVARADEPVGPAAGAKDVDEWLAYVAGETITRRMIVRELDEKGPDEPDASYERKIHERLIGRVINGVMLWKAKQMGLEARPSMVEEQVNAVAKEEIDRARQRDPSITLEKLLAKRGQSLDEYRQNVGRELVVNFYWRVLIYGGAGKRPQVDTEASPSESLRLYEAHRREFDQPAGVRLASFAASPEAFLAASGDRYDAAVEAARAHVRRLADDVKAGRRPEDVATANHVAKGDWAVTPEGKFVEKGRGGIGIEAVDAWAFDPARRIGDTQVTDGPRGTVASFVVLGVQPARAKAFEEAQKDVMERIQRTRVVRFKVQHMLEALAIAPVKPAALVEEVSDQLREQLKRLDEDPVARDIRLR